mgnify:CR=1 FL=1
MERQSYLDIIQERLAAYFDIERPYEYQHQSLEMYANSSVRNERYFASKKIKVYAIENKEHVFIVWKEVLTEKELDQHWNMLLTAAEELPEPHEEHMSTIINGVIMTTERPNDTLCHHIQKLKHEKSFLFGLKGWVYVRLIVINLQDGTLIHNKRGKEVIKVYSPETPA